MQHKQEQHRFIEIIQYNEQRFVLIERTEPLRYIKQSKICMSNIPEGNEKDNRAGKSWGNNSWEFLKCEQSWTSKSIDLWNIEIVYTV